MSDFIYQYVCQNSPKIAYKSVIAYGYDMVLKWMFLHGNYFAF